VVNEQNSPSGGSVMNLKKSLLSIAFVASILVAFGFQNSSEYKVLFEKAKFTMETKGDLKGTIDLFEKIIQKYPDQREYAAKSQLYIGICYEKLGLKQAQDAFQKVADDYPDQKETVNMAREKLITLMRVQTFIEEGRDELKLRQILTGSELWWDP
jgi:tetratricopeptide (TPR) repeat protein